MLCRAIVFILFFVLMLPGCAPKSAMLVRESPSLHETVISDLKIVEAVNKAEKMFVKCFKIIGVRPPYFGPGPGIGRPMPPLLSLFKTMTAKQDKVSFTLGNPLGVFLVVDMVAANNNTRIDIYSGISTWNSNVKRVKSWFERDSDECL